MTNAVQLNFKYELVAAERVPPVYTVLRKFYSTHPKAVRLNDSTVFIRFHCQFCNSSMSEYR